MVVVLNMMDAVKARGDKIHVEELEARLGVPVVPVSANRGEGVDSLRARIHDAVTSMKKPAPTVPTLGEKEDAELVAFVNGLPEASPLRGMSRWQLLDTLLLTENDASLDDATRADIQACRKMAAAWCGDEIDIALASARYEAIDALCRDMISRPKVASKSLSARLDRFALGRITGIPVFLLVMYLMFLFAINVGSAFIDFFDILVGTVLVDGLNHGLTAMGLPEWAVAVFANGVGGGIQTVATFIPVIAAMFLCLSFLEDSGYLARAAMVVDRGMRAIGLPGKAFVPMLVGFGCNVPAIMGTRTLESPRDRLISIMMIPYMSCGARLPVYALLVAIFFPLNGQNVVFALYLGGIAIAVLTGLVLKHTLLQGANTPFIMELPAYRMPTLRNMLTLTWERLKSFVVRAGKVIIVMVIALSFFNSLGTDGSFGNEDTDKSVLAQVGKTITPVFQPMGVEEKNWPATVGIVTGIMAKEAVIGTIHALYAQGGEDGATEAAAEEEGGYQPWEGIKEALASIPANLASIAEGLTDPLSIGASMDEVSNLEENEDYAPATVNNIRAAFGSTGAAIAFLIFILLYTPCAAALGAIYREAGGKWMALLAVWSLSMAWICATAFYQITLLGTAATGSAVAWLVGLAVVVVVLLAVLRWFGNTQTTLPATKAATDVASCH
jgi:ferrous iron transport protein B